MEPVTHVLMGATLARAGLNRKAAYATLTMAIAAEFPDIDTLWGMGGPVAGFQHHRGITHTFLGIPFEAALLVGCAWGLHRCRARRAANASGVAKPLTKAPVRWGLLYGFVVLALLSHIGLDFTNNYGVRPFFPFSPHWYAGSFVFIFDPLLFAVLLLALGLPSLFRLVSSEVGARRESFRGRGLALAALVFVCSYYGFRAFEHAQAVKLAQAESIATPQRSAETADTAAPADAGVAPAEAPTTYVQPQRVLASPDPLSPLRWYAAMDFGPAVKLGTVNLSAKTMAVDDTLYWKPEASAALTAALSTQLGRVYMDWSPMPLVTVQTQTPAEAEAGSALTQTYVTFNDPRFMADTSLLHTSGRSPLSGRVELDRNNRVLSETMDGRTQTEH